MPGNLKAKSRRFLFLFGLALAFISLFIDWYYFTSYKAGTLIAQWSFNTISGWHTDFIQGINSNENLRPNDSLEIFTMSIIFIGVIVFCGFGTIGKDVERTNSIKKSKPFIYFNVFLLILNGYFIVVMPTMFLFMNDMYFPFLIVQDVSSNVLCSYCIGPAYIMQVASFLSIFPHVLFSVITLNKFEAEIESPETTILKSLELTEDIPLDKFIAELESEARTKTKTTFIYEKFQRQRRRKNR